MRNGPSETSDGPLTLGGWSAPRQMYRNVVPITSPFDHAPGISTAPIVFVGGVVP